MLVDTDIKPHLFTPDVLANYVRKDIMPPLESQRLALTILGYEERQRLKTPVTGSHTLLISYKEYPGAVSSFQIQGESLDVAQLQGAQGRKGLRLCTGLHWIRLFADQLLVLGTPLHAQRITIPDPHDIEGVTQSTALENVLGRYATFIARLQMKFSQEEKRFVRDLP